MGTWVPTATYVIVAVDFNLQLAPELTKSLKLESMSGLRFFGDRSKHRITSVTAFEAGNEKQMAVCNLLLWHTKNCYLIWRLF